MYSLALLGVAAAGRSGFLSCEQHCRAVAFGIVDGGLMPDGFGNRDPAGLSLLLMLESDFSIAADAGASLLISLYGFLHSR